LLRTQPAVAGGDRQNQVPPLPRPCLLTKKNGKNAYGKCVSAMARGVTEQQTEARVNAAKMCKKLKAEHKADFETAYGTKENAFGKCVSKTAKVS
jgi:hypothetical protein